MSTTILVRDESPGGTLREFALEILTERLSVRELIRSRVYQEVDDYNRRPRPLFQGLVQPTETELALNQPDGQGRPALDWKPQFARALKAFDARQILILVDDRQVESLDEEIVVQPGTVVTFLRMTLLVGG
jgi:hypothetical protein